MLVGWECDRPFWDGSAGGDKSAIAMKGDVGKIDEFKTFST